MKAVVLVGYADARPIVPDARGTYVAVEARDETEAQLVAAQMTACRTDCVMPTSTEIVSVVL